MIRDVWLSSTAVDLDRFWSNQKIPKTYKNDTSGNAVLIYIYYLINIYFILSQKSIRFYASFDDIFLEKLCRGTL